MTAWPNFGLTMRKRYWPPVSLPNGPPRAETKRTSLTTPRSLFRFRGTHHFGRANAISPPCASVLPSRRGPMKCRLLPLEKIVILTHLPRIPSRTPCPKPTLTSRPKLSALSAPGNLAPPPAKANRSRTPAPSAPTFLRNSRPVGAFI